MKFSESWLREIINIDLTSTELAQKLTMIGHEVDSIEDDGNDINDILIGEIVNYKKHPNADKLNVCTVGIGGKKYTEIVCGAPNIRDGMKSALALPGQTLPNGLKIEKAKIRGVQSNGMLCSPLEIGLGKDSDGILELPDSAPVGMKLVSFLNLPDKIIDLDLTPNRGDCFSLYGISRDLAATPKSKLKIRPKIKSQIKSKLKYPIKTPYPELCPRFAAQTITNIDNNKKTPIYIIERLRKSGIRAINPIVDVTNYVMLEMGQPLHAYDQSKLQGTIKPRHAKKNESLVLLDGNKIKLNKTTIVVSDESGPIGLAGIMGGISTSVSSKTTTVLLEAAFWPPDLMVGIARKYGMHTDASMRFERGVDPEGQVNAINRTCELLLSICGGQAGPIIDISNKRYLPKDITIKLTTSRIEKILGCHIRVSDISKILNGLNFVTKRYSNFWNVKVPSYRFDIEIEDDLIEEIARIYGFNNIPEETEIVTNPLTGIEDERLDQERISNHLCSRDYYEVINYSFIEQNADNLVSGKKTKLILNNPISSEMSVMRSTLLPGLLLSASRNLARQNERVRLFEIGKVFSGNLDDHQEYEHIAAIIIGTSQAESWLADKKNVDFYNLKGDLESLLSSFSKVNQYTYESEDHTMMHPGQSASIKRNEKIIGLIGKLHPSITKKYNIKQDAYFFEINYTQAFKPVPIVASSVSKYPIIRRDIAIVIDATIPVSRIVDTASAVQPSIIKSIEVFDVYEGKNIEEGRKSVALGLILQEKSRTLTDKEADSIVSRILVALRKNYSAKLRE
ncbi:MAG: phenylalanine--tRNA ligase subunit beta [Pseudomonadota bacterium]|nr:phenylalanine--tRNA ligase subunit beta [Pseudomonadota bacterium]